MARPERFELPTPRFVVWCSIQLSYGRTCAPRGAQKRPQEASRASSRFREPGQAQSLGREGRSRWRFPSSRGVAGRHGRPTATWRSTGRRAAPYGPWFASLPSAPRNDGTVSGRGMWPPRCSEKPTFSCQTGRPVVYCSNDRRNGDGLRREREFFGDSQGDPNRPWRQLQASSRQDGVGAIWGLCLAVAFFAASACKALISPVFRSGIAIFCNFCSFPKSLRPAK
jgi:hypothetical protein